jgi:hypothetical protein
MSEFIPRTLDDLALSWPKELNHFSASSAKMAVRCPEQWRQRYVLGKKSPPSLSMLLGRADHKAIETSMEQKIKTYEDLPVKDVVERFHAEIDEEVRNVGIDELEIPDATGKLKKHEIIDKQRVHRATILQNYHVVMSPTVQPIAVEEAFSIEIPELPVQVVGYVDLVAVEPDFSGDGPYMIDRKHGKRSRTRVEPEWGIQAEVYQLHRPVKHVWHTSSDANTLGTLEQACPPRGRSERMLQQIVATIGFCYQKYGPDEPWPTTGKLHPWACGYCGFRETCWGWAE